VFDSTDRENGREVVLINRKLADTLWPGESALGKTIVAGDPPRKAIVVGVTADSKFSDLAGPMRPVLYFPLSQHYQPRVNVIARTSGDPRLWVEPIHQTMRNLGLYSGMRPVTFNDWMNFQLLSQRVTAGFVAILGALGLLLAIVGLFGGISHAVSERKKEFGIRVALGARSWELLRMVLRQTLLTTGIGAGIGVLLGVGTTMLLQSQFYGITLLEWTVLLPVVGLMLILSLIVAYLSAKPWIAIDPMEAVRHA
jgi:ABC-type antimicrobial peptide transport system permease subunit